MINNVESLTQFELQSHILPSGLSVVEYGKFPGVEENYKEKTGHELDILLPGVFSVKEIAWDAPVWTCENSKDVRDLSRIKGEEMVLVELVPPELVDMAIERMAEAVEQLINKPSDLPIVVSAVLNGGKGPFERIEALAPAMQGLNRQDVQVQRSYGGKLGDIKLRKDFEDVWNAHVIIIEDLGDEHLTLKFLAQRAKDLGAARVTIVMLMNKIGVPNKEFLKDLEIVGFGIPNLWVGGGGPDFMEGIGRERRNVMVMMTLKEYQAFLLKRYHQAVMGMS